MNTLITDRKDWKLRLKINDMDGPENYKHFQFVGEQYNNQGELINSSSYDFFLNKEEINMLSQTLWLEAT